MTLPGPLLCGAVAGCLFLAGLHRGPTPAGAVALVLGVAFLLASLLFVPPGCAP